MNANAALPHCRDRVFPPQATAEHYYPSESAEDARRRVADCVTRGDGPAVVIGAPGIGKTMLREVLTSSLAGHLRVINLTGGQLCTRRALLQAILYGMDLPYENREEGVLRLSLHRALKDQAALPAGVALLVDEAQSLKAKLVEELRLLTNLAQAGLPVVRLALFGGPGLEDLLATPELESFSQQIAARCYLNPLSYEETQHYVRSHIASAGADPAEVITADGLDAVWRATDGVPRVVSQIAERALAAAVAAGKSMIDAQVVQSAWSDLHQLPAPWNTPAVETQATVAPPQEGAVADFEFGQLDNAFEPGTPDAQATTPAEAGEPQRDAEWNADHALAEVAKSQQPAAAASDPFGGEFEDEEIVIDRFASLADTLPAGAPAVTNALDPTFSRIADAYQQVDVLASPPAPVEEQDAGFAAELDTATELDEVVGAADDDEDTCSTIPMAPAEEEPMGHVLIIEDDGHEQCTISRPMVRRREYRQLFAQLRQG